MKVSILSSHLVNIFTSIQNIEIQGDVCKESSCYKSLKMSIFDNKLSKCSELEVFQGLRRCNIGQKLVQTDQSSISPTSERFGHVQDHFSKRLAKVHPKKVPKGNSDAHVKRFLSCKFYT